MYIHVMYVLEYKWNFGSHAKYWTVFHVQYDNETLDSPLGRYALDNQLFVQALMKNFYSKENWIHFFSPFNNPSKNVVNALGHHNVL